MKQKRYRDVVARDSKLKNVVVVQNSSKSGCKTDVTGVPVLSERVFHDGLSISMMERLLSAVNVHTIRRSRSGRLTSGLKQQSKRKLTEGSGWRRYGRWQTW